PVVCPQCALPAGDLLKGGEHIDGRYRSGKQWQTWLGLIQQLYPHSGPSWRIRNPEGCSVCRKARLPELNGYAGRTVVAEIIEPGLGLQAGRSAMACAMHKAMEGGIDLRDIEIRFHAFETEHARRRAQGGQPLPAMHLRAVP